VLGWVLPFIPLKTWHACALCGVAQGTYPFGTSKFPYMCMAYRIPSSTKLNMLLLIELRNEDGSLRNHRVWKTLYLTNDVHHPHHAKIGVSILTRFCMSTR
jgi:hypothetical protein